MQEAEEQGQQKRNVQAVHECSRYNHQILVEYAAHRENLASHSFILVNALEQSATFTKTGQLHPISLSFPLFHVFTV